MTLGASDPDSDADFETAFSSFSKSNPDLFISIQPIHTNKILSGAKTVEFRRRFPQRDEIVGATVWIYSSSPTKAVVAVARVSGVARLPVDQLWSNYAQYGGIESQTFEEYFAGTDNGIAIRLSDIVTLSEDIPLSLLRNWGFHVPQSYRYVTDDVFPLLRDALVETSTRHQHCDSA